MHEGAQGLEEETMIVPIFLGSSMIEEYILFSFGLSRFHEGHGYALQFLLRLGLCDCYMICGER